MSLILEALRKSEAERRRGDLPDLRAELPPPASPRPLPLRRVAPWIAAVAACAIVAAWMLHPWSRGTPAPAPSPPATTAAPPERVRLQPRPRAAATPRPGAPRNAGHEPPKPQPAPQTATPAPATAVPPPTAVPAAIPPAPPATVVTQETLIGALPADLRKALPPLQLSMHMWDPDPAKRFVILDGERHVEGDSVGPLRIRRIDADGVLFDWQGRRLRLPLR